MEKLLISACLAGSQCKYSGGSNSLSDEKLRQLSAKYTLLPVCPELAGGLTVPRDPSERRGDTVVSCIGRDVTAEYKKGAQTALELCRRYGCTKALLKERSPSCGSGKIYDGSFTGKLIPGMGVTAELLEDNGVYVYGESELNGLLNSSGEVYIISALEKKEDIGCLFSEYTDMLLELRPEFAQYLDKQNYAEELEHLEGKYGLPGGRLYGMYIDGKIAGSVGLRRLDDYSCELKRLYVRPKYRGRKLGSILLHTVISDAEESGYCVMLLDTFPELKTAIEMYRRFGFYEIPSYNGSPMHDLVYMRLDIKKRG